MVDVEQGVRRSLGRAVGGGFPEPLPEILRLPALHAPRVVLLEYLLDYLHEPVLEAAEAVLAGQLVPVPLQLLDEVVF